MNQDLGLKVLGQIMGWSDDRARNEFEWLRLMARLKYDGYRDFQAGMRFIESLATWLQQFALDERETAYAFVRRTLVYIGPSEMQRLVEQFYPRTVRDRLICTVAAERGIPRYRVLADADARTASERLRRQTLFMGLSDGARIDTIRHANAGLLNNEQLVQGTQVDTEKWKDLLDNLRKDLGDPEARFRLVYLVDDFAGTGTSFLRYDEDKAKWKGKLLRFKDSVESANDVLGGDKLFADDWELCIHHYVVSFAAAAAIEGRLAKAAEIFNGSWARAMHASYGTILPEDLPIDAVPGRQDDFMKLSEKYYDPKIRTKHTDVGGATHLGLGYGGCALPLVLDHNTPNNAVALLWAETDGGDRDGVFAPAMRPLFRRRQRHA
ncbi:phosphoribosyltransferase-like protein [Microvirga arsenatis]|uniref:PRTase-CE domain-containing protein n=1 Tax=Microvirga arsenatis TaxID=2692265 RepID=A0ABW9Z7C7_9HYPH|nr:hypothetical protein [Microvirga arsenatis]NBJ13641.1 hypothetical protein [Microvirga arsenatis]NBJ27108.1 hypothetical protein [Microvirga arsenatis]